MSAFVQTRLVRSFPSGTRIHLATCKRPGRTVPWAWAEGRDDDEWLRFDRFKPCKVCLPDLVERQRAREGATKGSPGVSDKSTDGPAAVPGDTT